MVIFGFFKHPSLRPGIRTGAKSSWETDQQLGCFVSRSLHIDLISSVDIPTEDNYQPLDRHVFTRPYYF